MRCRNCTRRTEKNEGNVITDSANFLDFKMLPIFIISYNRKDTLKKCIEKFIKDGYSNLIILDNASTDTELLSYLKSLHFKVYFLEKNYGHHVLWDCGLFTQIINTQYFVLTDPDVLPVEECPTDYVEQFYKILQEHPDKTKVGFSLKLDDLPETYKYKYDIIRFESFYWEKRFKYDFPIYDAPIDTTFALYRPAGGGRSRDFYKAIRTGEPYIARHLGWYVNNFSQSDYFSDSGNCFSTSMNDSAMNEFRNLVIKRLSLRQDRDIYPLIKSVFSLEFAKNKAPWTAVAKCIFYIFFKKLVITLRLR